MDAGQGMTDGNPAESAIQQALAAEQTAREAVARCREEAEQHLLATRLKAREIAARADLRISTIHKKRAKLVKKQVQTILEESNASTDPASPERLAAALPVAAARLAAWLTGGDTATSRP